MKGAILLFAIFATVCYGCTVQQWQNSECYECSPNTECGDNQFCDQDDNSDWVYGGHCELCPSNGPDECYGLDSTYWSMQECISRCPESTPDVSTSEYIIYQFEQMHRYLRFFITKSCNYCP